MTPEIEHATLTDEQLHLPGFVQAGDPGAVGRGMIWIDTSGGGGSWVSKIRNDNDDGWEVVQVGADYAVISANDGNTDITGSELEELSDGSETALHSHSGAAYILHSLADAEHDFLVASGDDVFVKKTLAEVGAILEADIDHGNIQGLGTGADHSYIDQTVVSGASPTFDGSNFTGIPDGALDENYILHSLAGAANDFIIASGANTYIKKTLAETGAILEGDLQHDNLQGFVGNKHIDHTSVTLSAGTGLSGGGDISGNRSFALSHLGIENLADPGSDRMLMWDDTNDITKWGTASVGLSFFNNGISIAIVVDVGIADDKILQVDDADAANNDYAKFTAVGIEGRSYAEVRSDINVEDGSTADQTGAEIKASYEGEADTNAYDDAAVAKLGGIEATADITDTTNVAAAGAVMKTLADAANDFLVASGNDTFVKKTLAETGAILEGDMQHDNLQGFVGNEHIDHTSVTLTAGTGLSGGGTIAANRTFNVEDDYVKNAGDQIDGNLIIDNTATEALLVRQNADGGDVLIADTTNSQVEIYSRLGIGGVPGYALDVNSGGANAIALFESTDPNAFIYMMDGDTTAAGKVRIGADADMLELWAEGTNLITMSGSLFYCVDTVSSLHFVDRTPFFTGDALEEIKKIKGKDGEIDHKSLPDFVRKMQKIDGEEIEGRDLGAMVSMLAVAVQELDEKIS